MLALMLTGLGAFLSGNNLLFLVFAAMLALFSSRDLSAAVLAGLELELCSPSTSGQMPSAARIRLRNLKRLTPSFSIELSAPAILKDSVYFPLIPGRATVEAAVQVVFPRRGRHRENLFVISTRFPFGFLRKSTTVALHRETIVYPALEPRAGMQLLLDTISGEIESRSRRRRPRLLPHPPLRTAGQRAPCRLEKHRPHRRPAGTRIHPRPPAHR